MTARRLQPLLVLALAAVLSGCAAGATTAGMTLKPEEAVKPANPRMAGTVAVDVVGGGEGAAGCGARLDLCRFSAPRHG